jgi:hypothetical protein
VLSKVTADVKNITDKGSHINRELWHGLIHSLKNIVLRQC